MKASRIASLLLMPIIALGIFGVTPIAAQMELGQEITILIPGLDKVQLKFRLIPAGTYLMGSPTFEVGRNDDEGPMHRVDISKDYYMGIYEVTQAQWAAVMETYPVQTGYSHDAPVTRVSWEDCQRFITKLNAMGIGTFRLPTEAEWEYACRAGTTTRFPWGDDSSYCLIGQYAWYNANSSVSKDYPVGQKKPNAWGLYDMHGNVWEWCSDWYGRYMPERQADPIGPAYEYCRVGRGGWHYNEPQLLRSAQRYGIAQPSLATYYLGFRLVRTAP